MMDFSPSWKNIIQYCKAELGTQQFFSFATVTTRHRNRALGTRKFKKKFKSRCLDGVATTNIVILQKKSTLWQCIVGSLWQCGIYCVRAGAVHEDQVPGPPLQEHDVHRQEQL